MKKMQRNVGLPGFISRNPDSNRDAKQERIVRTHPTHWTFWANHANAYDPECFWDVSLPKNKVSWGPFKHFKAYQTTQTFQTSQMPTIPNAFGLSASRHPDMRSFVDVRRDPSNPRSELTRVKYEWSNTTNDNNFEACSLYTYDRSVF